MGEGCGTRIRQFTDVGGSSGTTIQWLKPEAAPTHRGGVADKGAGPGLWISLIECSVTRVRVALLANWVAGATKSRFRSFLAF